MRILYAGDSDVGGPANYLIGVLNHLGADFVHVPPNKTLTHKHFKKRFDSIVLSDYSEARVSDSVQRRIARAVASGTGLLMIGGWGSFSGPFGGWRGSEIERLLPVRCHNRDDRVNFPSGALVLPKIRHPAARLLDFTDPPAIAGLNRVFPKKGSRVVLSAKEIRVKRRKQKKSYVLRLDPKEHPLLVVGSQPGERVAALATDLAPHWCGGIIDWGTRRARLRVGRSIQVETGYLYLQLVSSLIRWLAPKPGIKRPR